MGIVSSEEKAKSGIARKGDRRCGVVDVFGCGVLVLVGLCDGCSEQSERRVRFLLVRRDALCVRFRFVVWRYSHNFR